MNSVIYLLTLEHGKYYVGKTTNIENRIKQHKFGEGSWWTKKYKYINYEVLENNADDLDEDKYTIKCMIKYGIDNVRGGTFSKLKLSNDELLVIKKMISHSKNECFKCGKSGHFAKDCRFQEPQEGLIFKFYNYLIEKCNGYNSF